MNDSWFEQIEAAAAFLNLDLSTQEIANLCVEHDLNDASVQAVAHTFEYLKKKKSEKIISTLLRLSRLPLKEPKTFEGFDFNQLHGKHRDALVNLPTHSALYAHKNIAFIGPQGVGKTHLAMAYGRSCCMKGMKTYFLKATELNQRFTDARKYGRESSTINGLVKPSCLIIDEVGRCVFDKENTRMFFDVIDRRYNKEGPNTIIFTSNKSPDKWGEFFNEDSTLLCALDRIFDDATVFMIKGNSYRGRKCETIALSAGERSALPKIIPPISLILNLQTIFTILTGASASGKTASFSFIRECMALNPNILCINYLDYQKDIKEMIRGVKGKLIVIDNADILLNDETRKYISLDALNQYLIIGRNPKNLFATKENLFELVSFPVGEQTEFQLNHIYRGI